MTRVASSSLKLVQKWSTIEKSWCFMPRSPQCRKATSAKLVSSKSSSKNATKLRLKVFNIHSTNHQLEDIIDLPLDWANHHYLHFLLWLVCLMQKLFTFYHKVATKNLSGEPIRPAVQCINRQSLIVNLESNVTRIRIFCICIFVHRNRQSLIVNLESNVARMNGPQGETETLAHLGTNRQ